MTAVPGDAISEADRGGVSAEHRPTVVFLVVQSGAARGRALARLRARFGGHVALVRAEQRPPVPSVRVPGSADAVLKSRATTDPRQQRVDVIVEDGFQDQIAALRRMQSYADAGYRTELVATSSAAYASQLATQQQYLTAQRVQDAARPAQRHHARDATAALIAAAMAVAACHVITLVDHDDVELVRLARDARGEWQPGRNAEPADAASEKMLPAQQEQPLSTSAELPIQDQAQDRSDGAAILGGDDSYVERLESIVADARSVEVSARDGDADIEEETQQIFEDHRHAERELAHGPRVR